MKCTERYGKPEKHPDEPNLWIWTKAGIKISGRFEADKCIGLTFQKVERHGESNEHVPFTKEELEKLLDANKGESKWEKPISEDGGTLWISRDERTVAILAPAKNDGLLNVSNMLMIMTGEMAADVIKAKTEHEKDPLKDF